MIESNYVSTATSPAEAVGLWQLMPRTARLNGLDTDGAVDERRDFWKATEAAFAGRDQGRAAADEGHPYKHMPKHMGVRDATRLMRYTVLQRAGR